MLQAVIFDFDGVITDSEVLHLRSFNNVLGQYGIEITKKDYYKKYLGSSDLDCFRQLRSEGKLNLDDKEIEDLIKQKNEDFEKLARTEGRLIAGVKDFLQKLKQNNITMAIYSGSLLTEIMLILEEAGLQRFFDVIVSAEQVRTGKPDPEGFLLALQKLNKKSSEPILAEHCIVIEDSYWGLEAARAAGMHTVAVTNSYDAEELKLAEKIVAHLNELDVSDLQKLCD